MKIYTRNKTKTKYEDKNHSKMIQNALNTHLAGPIDPYGSMQIYAHRFVG